MKASSGRQGTSQGTIVPGKLVVQIAEHRDTLLNVQILRDLLFKMLSGKMFERGLHLMVRRFGFKPTLLQRRSFPKNAVEIERAQGRPAPLCIAPGFSDNGIETVPFFDPLST
jgi:hypothetical protein